MSKVSTTFQDLGSVYSKTGSALTTSYTSGTTQSTGSAERLTLLVALSKPAMGSSVTSVQVKLQILDASGNAYDVMTTLNDTSGTTTTAQSLTPTAGSTVYFVLQSSNHAPAPGGWRVQGKATGGAGIAGDTLSVSAIVM